MLAGRTNGGKIARSSIKKTVRKRDYKKLAVTLAKKIVREREKRCQWCGRIEGVLHGAHIISVRYAGTAAETANILCLCYRCHFYRWHSNPAEAMDWFNKEFPGRLEPLWEKAREINKPDWEEIYNKLKEENERSIQQ